MAPRTDTFDLSGLRLTSGEGRHLELAVGLGSLELGGERYPAIPSLVPVRLDMSRTTGQGYALRLRFSASLEGPCMRCLEPATPVFEVDAREISQPGEGDELNSPYIEGGVLELAAWAHDSLALALPAALLCRPDCAGLCPVCGENLNLAGPDHHHEAAPDPRWAKLAEIQFEPPASE
ncbi:MAG TPA: DUF177 domain-containing protein [Solirubrobacteraceae bacterium]|jgi:uncharacterized protein|nr:DUF177 domain-containing protein [Solirubrobacteraceae bacterium]